MMIDRILIIGEAPSGDGPPLEGRVGARIAEYASITEAEYLQFTDRHNLFNAPISDWVPELARRSAEDIWPSMVGRATMLLGARVVTAFSLNPSRLHLDWQAVDGQGTIVSMLPHPSGRNLWWNEAENRAAARRFLERTFGTKL